MRKVIDEQMRFGGVDISTIKFDLRSRDEIPKLLMGLQYIYCADEIRSEVFQILREMVPAGTDPENGRPGMELWKILVLGTLRLNCNWDYDKVKEIADHHDTLRMMLGHSDEWGEDKYLYPIQTIRDNVSLFTPEVLNRINEVVVKAGHKLVKKKEEEIELAGRCDSSVVETDVHYPTDINLLFDAMRKVIALVAGVCDALGLSLWRQSAYNERKLKRLYRRAQSLKRSRAKKKERVEEKNAAIAKAHQEYVDRAEEYLQKAAAALDLFSTKGVEAITCMAIEHYMAHAVRQIDQIRRRVLEGEKIPHGEKVFSIFEEHTEWITKGKAGMSQELGLKVCVVEDQHGFILTHLVMKGTGDAEVATALMRETKERFPQLHSCSFDKGFYSPENIKQLQKILDLVVLPKKGRLNEEEKAHQSSDEFVSRRRKHSAVESGISALENHGLDRCPDHGLRGFERYVALAVLARNIQILGTIIWKRKLSEFRRQQAAIQHRKTA